jgi:hypothetical protein
MLQPMGTSAIELDKSDQSMTWNNHAWLSKMYIALVDLECHQN